jgi:hypothetical protein
VSSAWTRRPDADAPLPRTARFAVTVALTVYQGHTTVSLQMSQGQPGIRDRHMPLWLYTVDDTPETYGRVVELIYEALAAELETLESQSVG